MGLKREYALNPKNESIIDKIQADFEYNYAIVDLARELPKKSASDICNIVKTVAQIYGDYVCKNPVWMLNERTNDSYYAVYYKEGDWIDFLKKFYGYHDKNANKIASIVIRRVDGILARIEDKESE